MKSLHSRNQKRLAKLLTLSLVLGCSSLTAEETSLREQLIEKASQSKTPAAAKEKMAQHLKSLTDSDLVDGALKVGDTAPDFRLKDHLGVERSLSEFLKEGPVVLTWYRGGW